jgi:hypothetical protein
LGPAGHSTADHRFESAVAAPVSRRAVEAIAIAPLPTPEVLWRKPPALAVAALRGRALGRLGEPSSASPAAWAAVGAQPSELCMVRRCRRGPKESVDELAARLERECMWLVANEVLPADVVSRNRRLAEAAPRPWAPVFTS